MSDEGEGDMSNFCTRIFTGLAVLAGSCATAFAASLSIVTVGAPAINCVFETDCTIPVTDSVGNIPMPTITGTARLQSRTFTGMAGAPAAGKTGYEYRLDLTQAMPIAEYACVTDLEIDFGPVAKLNYDKDRPLEHVFVVTKGGLGKVGLLSAEQTGDLILFTFSQPVCAGESANSTFFFGLASNNAPVRTIAKVGVPGLLPVDVPARAPKN
jgi:hypothetical protein